MEFSSEEHCTQPFPSPGDLPNPGIEPALQVDSLPAEPPGKPKNTGVSSLSLLQGIFPTQNQTGVSCIAGRFFTSRDAWEAQMYMMLYVNYISLKLEE